MNAPRRWPIPASQDPFVNTPLISVGSDDAGTEWFWTSSWNSTSGTTGLLVSADGDHRVFDFDPPHSGFYSAVAENSTTLWLCGDLSRVVRLDLITGQHESFDTGAPSALVFAGMAFDPDTGKLFAAAFPPPDRVAFSFDTRQRETVQLYRNFVEEHYPTANVRRADGTYSIVMYNPDIAVLHWDPRAETLEPRVVGQRLLGVDLPYSNGQAGVARVITDEAGHLRLPGAWYDAAADQVVAGPEPDEELTWFGRRGRRVWGVGTDGDDARIVVWDLNTGHVTELGVVPDATHHSVNLTRDGDVIAVSVYGIIHRLDGVTGQERFRVPTPTEAIAHVDCLRRIDDRRLVGTPFITQRFWELDLETGVGVDQGRATSGPGEVLQTWRIGSRIYQASYCEGQLSAYDPDAPVDFGTNPRVVAQAPTGMRPIAAADDGRRLFYSCSHHYGHVGGILTRYDTVTQEVLHRDDPLPDLAIGSLVREPVTGLLVAGSTTHADCDSTPPRAAAAQLALIDPETLDPVLRVDLPDGVESVRVVTIQDGERVVCLATPPGADGVRWFTVPIASLAVPDPGSWQLLPAGADRMVATTRSGVVVLVAQGRHELWDLAEPERLKVLADEPGAYLAHVENDDLFLVTKTEIVVLEGVLEAD